MVMLPVAGSSTFDIAAVVCCILRIDATIGAISALKRSIGKFVTGL
jgi:hypothetical protein